MKISTVGLLALSLGAWWALRTPAPVSCPASGCGLLGLAAVDWASRGEADKDAPRGHALETHTTEIDAGGCIVSSEEDTYGRYVIHAWAFEGGRFSGVSLKGLRAAFVEYGRVNLAKPGALADGAILYLPEEATPAQRAALRDWILARPMGPRASEIEERIVALHFDGARLVAGDQVEVRTISAPPCSACGARRWYAPRRTDFGPARVDLTEKATFRDARRGVMWNGGDRRSSFVGTFGPAFPQLQLASH
jgi:hypothetical protein